MATYRGMKSGINCHSGSSAPTDEATNHARHIELALNRYADAEARGNGGAAALGAG